MYCVYQHIRLDKNEVFYIGVAKFHNAKGLYDRAFQKSGRNRIWKNITSKTKFKVEILYKDVCKEFASEKESLFVKVYGKICDNTGTLANLADGGYFDYHGSTAKGVSCYDLNGIYIESFRSLTDAVGKYGGSTGCLHDVLNNKKQTMSKLQWRYGNSITNIGEYRNKSLKGVEQWSIDGKVFIKSFSSIKEAAKSVGLKTSAPIVAVCKKAPIKKNNRKNPSVPKSAGGYFWKYINH